MIRRLASAVAVMAIVAIPNAWAQDFPEFSDHVVDEADVVPDEVEQQVNRELADHQRRLKNQIAVAVVETTGNASIEDYANDLFEEWGIGDAEEDNGVLLLIAMEDRRLRIETGFGVEDEITDLESGRMISEILTPRMREGDIGGAILQSTREMRRKLGDDQVEAPPPDLYQEEEQERRIPSFGFLVPLIIFGVLSGFGRRRGRRRGWMVPVFWGGGWGGGSSGGFGGGGFGGGGFGGGGGGGSGGGGASGGW